MNRPPDRPEEGLPDYGDDEHAGHGRGKAAFSDAAFERAKRMLRAVGDVGRLRLLELLSRGEMCVTEIAAVTGEGLSTVSQRLGMLRGEDLVVGRREGKHVLYSLSDSHVVDLILGVLAHADEAEGGVVGVEVNPRREERSLEMTNRVHTGHDHAHGPGCGHTAVGHEGHTDYLHDGHLHHVLQDGSVEEHALEVGEANPEGCTPDHSAEHDPDHQHGSGCGHEPVPHGDHTDYLVGDHLHHPHGDHCDHHGPVEVAS